MQIVGRYADMTELLSRLNLGHKTRNINAHLAQLGYSIAEEDGQIVLYRTGNTIKTSDSSPTLNATDDGIRSLEGQ